MRRCASGRASRRVQSEAIIGDIAGDDAALLASLDAPRKELDELDSVLDAAELRAREIPSRSRHLLLVHKFGRHLVKAHRDWLAEVERELGPPGTRRSMRTPASGRKPAT